MREGQEAGKVGSEEAQGACLGIWITDGETGKHDSFFSNRTSQQRCNLRKFDHFSFQKTLNRLLYAKVKQ